MTPAELFNELIAAPVVIVDDNPTFSTCDVVGDGEWEASLHGGNPDVDGERFLESEIESVKVRGKRFIEVSLKGREEPLTIEIYQIKKFDK